MLFFDPGTRSDAKNEVYQALIDRYKMQGKSESYRNVDIQHKVYKYSDIKILGPALDQLSSWWWDYGHSRGLILRNTLILLGIFLLINTFLIKKLLAFYPIIDVATLNEKRSAGVIFVKNFVNIFIFTLYIFFSLNIDLEKLDSKKTTLMVYFFFQYFIGLICLFFLFNTVLKI